MIATDVHSWSNCAAAEYFTMLPPTPCPVESHSASSAPVTAPGTETRAAANSDGSAPGIATLRSAARLPPPYTCTRSRLSLLARLRPNSTDASAGNSTTIVPMTATDAAVPRPVSRMMTGAIDTSGTLRSSSASGITPASTALLSVKSTASTIAVVRPTTKPNDASVSDFQVTAHMSDRCSAAVDDAPSSVTKR